MRRRSSALGDISEKLKILQEAADYYEKVAP